MFLTRFLFFLHLSLMFLKSMFFKVKKTCIPNGLAKYMSFTINNKLSFIDSFQFLSSSLDSLVKNLSKNDFKV